MAAGAALSSTPSTDGLLIFDANSNPAHRRLVLGSGGPGTGNTEAMMHLAVHAAAARARVLIACSREQIVSMYRERMPVNENIVVEKASSKVAREAGRTLDVPPGRQRHSDLIVSHAGGVPDGSGRLR